MPFAAASLCFVGELSGLSVVYPWPLGGKRASREWHSQSAKRPIPTHEVRMSGCLVYPPLRRRSSAAGRRRGLVFSQLVLGCAVGDLQEVRDGVRDEHGAEEAREARGADESERERGGYPLGEA